MTAAEVNFPRGGAPAEEKNHKLKKSSGRHILFDKKPLSTSVAEKRISSKVFSIFLLLYFILFLERRNKER